MSCTRCGALIAPGSRSCPACGKAVAPEWVAPAAAVAPAGGAMRGYEPPASPLDAPAPVSSAVPPKNNGFAVVSLSMGIIWYFWIGSILALIFGYIAKRQIDASQGRQKGRGFAIAGIVLGWVGIGTLALVIIAAIVAAALKPR
jgi:Domain of unknown function (DUF4190)